MKSKVRFLHIQHYDKKFFDVVLEEFKTDDRIENIPVVVAKNREEADEIAKEVDNAKIVYDRREIKSLLKSLDYDVVFFHTLTDDFWYILDSIPSEKTVIWWAWGFDIYSSVEFAHPFIPIDELRPKTRRLFKHRSNKLKQLAVLIRNFYHENKNYFCRHKVLSRFDYFQPVLQNEYELMKKYNPNFRAKEFYYPNSFGHCERLKQKCPDEGNILLGNSATYSNNHLDAWDYIEGKTGERQITILPINYGISEYANLLTDKLKGHNNVRLIKEMMPRNEYFALMGSCSYVVMGVIRQQAMGNIFQAVSTGAKLFLFRDSVVYQWLKAIGFKVFAIEDIDEQSFKTALSLDDANHNIEIFNNEELRRDKVLDGFFESWDKA